jgi:hypothetical protein
MSSTLICRGHIGDTMKVFLAAPRTPSSASVFLWLVRVTFSHPAFTAITQGEGKRNHRDLEARYGGWSALSVRWSSSCYN